MSGAILVTAKAKGFYGALRKPGDVFEIADEQAFADRWMVRGGQTEAIMQKRGVSPAEQARQEKLASGGANAALTTALADLKDAAEREAALLAKVTELEAAIATRDAALAEAGVEAPADSKEQAPVDTTVAPNDAPKTTAPVQRVRRTAAPAA